VAASDAQRSRIVKLLEAAYLLGKEELPFSKFSSIVNSIDFVKYITS